ncbi:hypothetical protein II906_12310 [bacterium]|nr:hypothetical protein [bacterium]
MKKLYFSIMLLVMMVVALSLTACGGDDEDEGQKSLIDASYNKVKSQIIGTWIYEAEYKTSVNPYKDLGGVYNKLGWNERESYKSLTFKTDGILIQDFYGEKTLSYILTAEYLYKNNNKEYSDYYPFKNGGVLLSFDSKSYFVDIVNGKLILYDTYDGSPIDRYRKN